MQTGELVGDQIRDQVWRQVGIQVGDSAMDQVVDQVGDKVMGQVEDQVGDKVMGQVEDKVWDLVWDKVKEMKNIPKSVELLDRALSENGIELPGSQESQSTLDNLCDLIGVLHRELSHLNLTDSEIDELIAKELPDRRTR